MHPFCTRPQRSGTGWPHGIRVLCHISMLVSHYAIAMTSFAPL